MEQLNNISQLRNLWLRSPDERLSCWREFRLELQDGYAACGNDALPSLNAISTWWTYTPIVSVAMDPFNLRNWPNIWEVIFQGECCKYSRGLAMAYNMYYLDESAAVRVSRVRDTKYNDEYIIAIWNEEFVLNSLHGNVVKLQDVEQHFDIRESWTIQDIANEKQN